jgi:hypothetical protein
MSDTKHDDGGFAFPWTSVRDGTTNEWCTGMTLLDWFAGQLAASLMTPEMLVEAGEMAEEDKVAVVDMVAGIAYDQAEALVAEKRRRERGANDES